MNPRLLYVCLGIACLCYWLIYRSRRRTDLHIISLASALRHMKTGDLILFSGRNVNTSEILQSALILSATYVYRAIDACEWGHVGMVYKPTPDKVYLVHCEMINASLDVFVNEPVSGVKIVDLQEKLNKYKGYCAWRPINKEIEENKLLFYLRQTYHMNYSVPINIWTRLFDRLLNGHTRLPSEDRTLSSHKESSFCTEWLGAFFEFAGVFDKQYSPYNGYYLPSDFTYRRCEKYLHPKYHFQSDGYEIIM